MIDNVRVAGWPQSSELHGIPLRINSTYGRKIRGAVVQNESRWGAPVFQGTPWPKTMAVLMDVEREHPGIGLTLRPEFFQDAAMDQDEKDWWKGAEDWKLFMDTRKAVDVLLERVRSRHYTNQALLTGLHQRADAVVVANANNNFQAGQQRVMREVDEMRDQARQAVFEIQHLPQQAQNAQVPALSTNKQIELDEAVRTVQAVLAQNNLPTPPSEARRGGLKKNTMMRADDVLDPNSTRWANFWKRVANVLAAL